MALPGWKKLVAIAIGILCGGLPLIGFNLWLEVLVQRQNLDDVGVSAARSIEIAETRLDQAVTALDILEIRGVTECTPDQMDILRQAALTATSVKDLLVLDGDGNVLCSGLDAVPGRRLLAPAARAIRFWNWCRSERYASCGLPDGCPMDCGWPDWYRRTSWCR